MDLDRFLADALTEDLGPGDLTTDATVPRSLCGMGRVVAKQELVVAGQEVGARVFPLTASRLGFATTEVQVRLLVPDGERVTAGTCLAEVHAPTRVLLTGERLALNLWMKLCGIATHTRRFVDATGPDGPAVVDTRKTTPLLRDLEKEAVRCGGARNHRRGLYDGVLVKDNHVDAVGSLSEAVRRARAASHHLVRVQVEVRTLQEVEEALGTEADALLLDNFDDDGLREAVRRVRAARPRLFLEASGNLSLERLPRLRHLGLDAVSIGALIHQATWSDLSMKIRSLPG